MNGPMSLGDIFGGDNGTDVQTDGENEFQQNYELQNINILDTTLKIRQFSWHQTNANQVWPGTFRLAEYIISNSEKYNPKMKEPSVDTDSFNILELGAATGALSIFLQKEPYYFNMITSDIDDGGEVYENLCFNYELNGI